MADSGVSMVDFLKALWSDGCSFDAYEKLVLVVLASRTHNPGSVLYRWPDKVAQETLAKECSVGRQKLVSMLKGLTEKGYILRLTDGRKKTVQQYCITAKSYVDYLLWLVRAGRCIEKGWLLLNKIECQDEVCRIDLASEISRCRRERQLNTPVVVNSDIKTEPVVVNSDISVVVNSDTERSIGKKEFSGKEEFPPTPKGAVVGGSSFPSLDFLKAVYERERSRGLNADPWPDPLPRRIERCLEATLKKYPTNSWFKYLRDLNPLLDGYTGTTGFLRVFTDRPIFEKRIKNAIDF